MESEQERRGYLVSGRVQGVGFRWSTVREARDLGVQGAVWNRPDGRVELHVRGPGAALDRLERWLREGPPGARVVELEHIAAGEAASTEGFRILHP